MKFYNRENELRILEKVINGKGTRIVIVRGIRRIGKTRLVLEALKDRNYIRVFIPKDKTAESFLIDSGREYSVPVFTRLKDFLLYIFEKYEFVFLDEFQNFEYMDKSVFSDLQDIIDNYKNKGKSLCLFVSGSSYSMLKKIFFDYAKALYGRKDLEIPLFEFDSLAVSKILHDIGIEDIEDVVKFWSVFGGIPKFYELLENLKIKSFEEFMDIFYIQNFKSLLEEGKSILVSELGGDYKIYFTVMEAIANSKTKINEIAAFFGNDTNAANRYLNLLIKEYNLVRRQVPLAGKNEKIGRYKNKSNFFDFWFEFVHKYYDAYDLGHFEKIKVNFKNNFNSYTGRKFEGFVADLLKSGKLLPSKFTELGNQWGIIPAAPKGENVYEIDLVGLNEQTKEILFCECKWQDRVDPEKVIEELKVKAKLVDWNTGKRKEYYCVIAKSFSKKIKGKDIFLFDLKDIKKISK